MCSTISTRRKETKPEEPKPHTFLRPKNFPALLKPPTPKRPDYTSPTSRGHYNASLHPSDIRARPRDHGRRLGACAHPRKHKDTAPKRDIMAMAGCNDLAATLSLSSNGGLSQCWKLGAHDRHVFVFADCRR